MRCDSARVAGPRSRTRPACKRAYVTQAGLALWTRRAAMLLLLTADAAAQRRVTFRAEDGATLSAAYYEPSRRPAPGIVLLHMQRRSHADWDAAASQLADAGFAVLALDYRSGDELGALRDRREGCESISARAPRSDARQHRPCRRVDWREPGGARCCRRSWRAVDRAAVAGTRLQGAAHRSRDEKVRREARVARRQHEGSVRRAIDPSPDDNRSWDCARFA